MSDAQSWVYERQTILPRSFSGYVSVMIAHFARNFAIDPARHSSLTMRKIVVLLLLIFLSVSCMCECQSGTAATDFEHVAGDALQAMQKRAAEISAIGAGMVAYIPGDATSGWSSRMIVVGKFIKDDTNLLAVVYTKAAEMADTLKDHVILHKFSTLL